MEELGQLQMFIFIKDFHYKIMKIIK
ncbi:hypothetical protein Mgra_00009765 [Meloidogyne graminicola]|uniref:Uncharacterized protein n=1 Tax=Meloidogyne graminicola TaxID=189291 RepID=A0A8S9ZB68_9BILA|nr:hypothetical protein Mgra_00009765 [Meloidogyne graminicola]